MIEALQPVSLMLSPYYDWIRTVHIIFVISWMAGLFHLPRLYVYHAAVAPDSPESAIFKVMERKLFAIIMVPAAWLAYLTGGTMLLAKPELLLERWMIVKLMAVVLMTALHLMMTGWRDDFAADSNRHAHVFYRVINEVPTVLVIVIVIMAIIEPF